MLRSQCATSAGFTVRHAPIYADSAIFDLYELTASERDLIQDLCDMGLEFFYRGSSSKALSRNKITSITQGTGKDLRSHNDNSILGYIKVFLERWNRELGGIGGELHWQIVRALSTPMLAAVFTTAKIGVRTPITTNEEFEWENLLQKLDKTLITPISHRIYIDGLLRVVTDTNIIVVKRDEQRLWTRSQAREDVDATLFQAMIMQERISK